MRRCRRDFCEWVGAVVGQPGPEVVVVERSQAAGSREHALVCEATDDGEHGVGELEPVSGSRVGCDEAMQSLTNHLKTNNNQNQRRITFKKYKSFTITTFIYKNQIINTTNKQ